MRKADTKKYQNQYRIIIFISLAIVAIFAIQEQGKLSLKNYQPTITSRAKNTLLTPEKRLANHVYKHLRSTLGNDPEIIVGVDFNWEVQGKFPPESMTVRYIIKGSVWNGMINENDIVQSIMVSSRKLINDPVTKVFKHYLFNPIGKFVDKYGQPKDQALGLIKIKTATLEKINWKEMDSERFKRILQEDGYYQISRLLN